MKNILLNLFTFFATLLLLLLAGEVALRVYYPIKRRIIPGYVKDIELDDTLGWHSTPNLNVTTTTTDAVGTVYPLHVSTNAWGFRLFGDTTRTDKLRLFVLGDSFTQATEVSDDKTYFAYLRDSLKAEVFAYGCGGYGTAQEYLVLDRYLDRIRPDMVLLQYCYNDFINNDLALELRSTNHNNSMKRPYLLPDGRIELRFPKKSLTGLRQFANAHSRILYFIFTHYDRATRGATPSIEVQIEAGGPNQPLLRESVRVTEHLLKKIKARLPRNTRLVLVPITGNQPYYDALLTLAHRNALPMMEGIDSTVLAAERRGVVVRAADMFHWNEAGHRIAAGSILKYLQNDPRFVCSPQSWASTR